MSRHGSKSSPSRRASRPRPSLELVVDQDEAGELHREQRGDLVQHDPRDRLGVPRAGERVGDGLDRLELALAERRPLLGSAAAPEEPVESGGATIRLHWAFVMIGPRAAVRRGRFLTCKDGSYGLLAGRRPRITVVAHWAMRTAAVWLQARGEHSERPAAPTPPSSGLFRFWGATHGSSQERRCRLRRRRSGSQRSGLFRLLVR